MGQKIPNDKAKKLFDNWTGTNQPGNSKSPGKAIKAAGFKDTFETWFSVEELEAYLEYVKENIPDNPGIRIYFGNYGGNAGPADDSCTVFLSPTSGGKIDDLTNSLPENDYDLESYNSGTGGNPPQEYEPTS